jgi:hypothetical protein
MLKTGKNLPVAGVVVVTKTTIVKSMIYKKSRIRDLLLWPASFKKIPPKKSKFSIRSVVD